MHSNIDTNGCHGEETDDENDDDENVNCDDFVSPMTKCLSAGSSSLLTMYFLVDISFSGTSAEKQVQ